MVLNMDGTFHAFKMADKTVNAYLDVLIRLLPK